MDDNNKNVSSTSCCESTASKSMDSCCGSADSKALSQYWVTDTVSTAVGEIPRVSTELVFKDKLGYWKARWGINRMNYKVEPGLYCVGEVNSTSPVFVTANYKMTFDILRRELAGLSAWILVLDTKGINVWCAAGKGTFGTDEIVRRTALTRLSQVVDHKILILPQLGAPGVSAHDVSRRTGFKVVYGPVRAADIKKFINNGMNATPEMRKVNFTIKDRFVLTPIELVGTLKTTLMILGVLFLFNLISPNSFGIVDFLGYIGAVIVGCFLVPVFLPWLPGRAFAVKGWTLGLIWSLFLNFINGWPYNPDYSLVRAISYVLVFPAVSAFYAMNFTGASTYTSFSGVLKEMKAAIPAIIISLAFGIVLILASAFIPGI